MSGLLTLAQLALAITLFWHSANSPNRDAVLRTMLYAFAFSVTCFGAAGFLALFGSDQAGRRWMIDLGHVSLVAFGALWVARETGRLAKLGSE